MSRKRRIAAGLAALGLGLELAGTPAAVLTARAEKSGQYNATISWTLDDAGTLTVSGDGTLISGRWGLAAEDVRKVVIESGITDITGRVFKGFEEMTSVTIPDTVVGIGEYAFAECGLTELTIPESVEVVSWYAFADCPDLETVSLPQSLIHMELGAFYGCTSLKSVTLPDHLEQMDFNAFQACTSLTEVLVSEENPYYTSRNGILYSLDGKTLLLYPSGKRAKRFRVPDGVTAIGGCAFSGNGYLQIAIIPDSVKEIGRDAFANCPVLEVLAIPDSVVDIGAGLIYNSPNALILCNNESPAAYYAQNFCLPYATFWELPEETGLCGDVNQDEAVDIMDVIALNKYILGVAELGDDVLSNADANADGTVDAADSLVILKYVVDILDSLPYEN